MKLKPVLGSQLQLGHPLTKDIVGCWLMNEGSGEKAFDISQYGLTVDAYNSPVWNSGFSGPALSFNGSNQYLYNSSIPILEPPFTISAWFNATSVAAYQCLVHIKNSGSANEYHQLLTSTTPNVMMRSRSSADGFKTASSPFSFSSGVWNLATGVVASYSERYSYTNGSNKGTNTDTVNTSNPGQLHIARGYRYSAELYFFGLISSVMIWNRALSDIEVKQLYDEPYLMFEQEPIDLLAAATSPAAPVGAAGIMTTNTGFWGATY